MEAVNKIPLLLPKTVAFDFMQRDWVRVNGYCQQFGDGLILVVYVTHIRIGNSSSIQRYVYLRCTVRFLLRRFITHDTDYYTAVGFHLSIIAVRLNDPFTHNYNWDRPYVWKGMGECKNDGNNGGNFSRERDE